MDAEFNLIPYGGVTSPGGFLAGAACAGIKNYAAERLDLGILFSEVPCIAAAVFTTNKVKAAPVLVSGQRLQGGRSVALVVNSGCANACTGEQGLADALKMAELAAGNIGISPEDVLVASTGVIGHPLPMERIKDGIGKIVLSPDGGRDFAKAIMTTDTIPKEAAVRVEEGGFIIGGVAKGSGMIHPNLATMLCFLTTDAAVDLAFLRQALREAVDMSFNMVSIDGDTSTNDMVLIMANGCAGGEVITKGSRNADMFQQALNQVCIQLAKHIARDGEGATRLIQVIVRGAAGTLDARLAARTIVNSPLVKAAVHGSDPNWGRIIAAAGRSGAEVVADKCEIYIGDECLVRDGCALPFNEKTVVGLLGDPEVAVTVNLNLGSGEATAWGCDLSEEYVTINSEYTT